MTQPCFSIVVTTYNRAEFATRCVETCLSQSFSDFEVVVVDDASTDDTAARLRRYDDPRLRVIVRERNGGVAASRQRCVEEARGQWLVFVDSDWELMPHSLQRLHEVIARVPEGVRVVRSRLVWDDGHVTPAFVPEGVVDYVERLRWLEALAQQGYDETDAGRCIHRAVFDTRPFYADRQVISDTLWELELARQERTLFIPDILGLERSDAPNSYLRATDRTKLFERLRREAADTLWMAETALQEHGQALRDNSPSQLGILLKIAAVQAFLLGQRRRGAGYARAALRLHPRDTVAWSALVLGMFDPHAVEYGTLALRKLQARARRA